MDFSTQDFLRNGFPISTELMNMLFRKGLNKIRIKMSASMNLPEDNGLSILKEFGSMKKMTNIPA